VPGVGPGDGPIRQVWPNEWPNGQRRHDIERHCVAPVTIEPATGAPAGRWPRCRRAHRTCATAAADGVSLRVLDASLPGAWSQVPLGTRSRGRQAAGGEARACRSRQPRALPALDERSPCRPTSCEGARAWRRDRSRRRSSISACAPAGRLRDSSVPSGREQRPGARRCPHRRGKKQPAGSSAPCRPLLRFVQGSSERRLEPRPDDCRFSVQGAVVACATARRPEARPEHEGVRASHTAA
jgi:hypothetical protein